MTAARWFASEKMVVGPSRVPGLGNDFSADQFYTQTTAAMSSSGFALTAKLSEIKQTATAGCVAKTANGTLPCGLRGRALPRTTAIRSGGGSARVSKAKLPNDSGNATAVPALICN